MSLPFGLLNQPLYGGSAVSTEVPYPYHCAIGGHPYMIDTKKFARTTIELTRQGFDPSAEPSEQSLSSEGIWKRWGDDWAYGAGQLNYDAARDADRRRFFASEGIDVWTERGEITLLGATENKLATTEPNVDVLAVGDYLYVSDGTNVKHTTDATPTSPTFTTVAAGGTVSSMTSDGKYIYVAIGTEIRRGPVGGGAGSIVAFAATPATLVGYANGRLLCAAANELKDVSAAGSATVVYTHFNPDVEFVSIAGAPTGAFVGVNNGDRGEFLYVGLNATTGALAVPLSAGALNAGETVYAMKYYQGVMALGTSRGLRVADIVQDNGLAQGPVIHTDQPVLCLGADAEYIWFGLTNGTETGTGVGRANLARPTTHPNVPAWASDLMAALTAGDVVGIARFHGRTYFAVALSGVWGPHADELVESGFLDTGWIRYGTVERLVAYSVDLYHAPLQGSISVALVDEEENRVALGENTAQGSVAPASPFDGHQTSSYAFRLVLTLNRGEDPATGPVLMRWVMRSIVAPVQVERINVPILLFAEVTNATGDGNSVFFDTMAEWDYLKGLEATRAIVQFQMFGIAAPVMVRQLQLPEGSVRGWGVARETLDATVYVQLMTLEQ